MTNFLTKRYKILISREFEILSKTCWVIHRTKTRFFYKLSSLRSHKCKNQEVNIFFWSKSINFNGCQKRNQFLVLYIIEQLYNFCDGRKLEFKLTAHVIIWNSIWNLWRRHVPLEFTMKYRKKFNFFWNLFLDIFYSKCN